MNAQVVGAGRHGLHHRGSVASLHSITSFALSIGQKEAWKKILRELHGNGITADMINAKKDEIFRLFRSVSVLGSSSINPDEGKQEGRQDNLIQWPGVQLDVMVDVLSLPMTRARYFLARLVRGESELHDAASEGRTNLVKVLLDRGASIDVKTHSGSTALHEAARSGHIEVVKVLLDRGASIDAATNDDSWTGLHLAASNGHIEILKLLLDRGASMDATMKNKWTALHSAAYYGHIEIVKLLLDRGAKIDATTNNNSTALHLAASKGHIEIVKLLLDRGASIDAMDVNQWTALRFAASRNHIEIVKLLSDRSKH